MTIIFEQTAKVRNFPILELCVLLSQKRRREKSMEEQGVLLTFSKSFHYLYRTAHTNCKFQKNTLGASM